MFAQQSQIPRSPFASTITLIVHAGLGALVWVMTAAVADLPRARERLTYVVMMSPPAVPVVLPPTRSPMPEPLPRPEPPKVIEMAVATPPPPPPLKERAAPPPPPSPKVEPPPPPKVVVGAFAERIEAAERRLRREVLTTGFENSAAQVVPSRGEVREVGGFDADARTRSTATRAVVSGDAGFAADHAPVAQRAAAYTNADTGFGSAQAPATRRAVPGTVDSSGFGSNAPAAAAQAPAPREVASTGFADAAKPTRTASRVTEPQQVNRSVEVTYKPRPEYTDEARQLRIEGEVLLDVEFTAEGSVRVLRVARGLGHGLDDMACRAVQQIRFNPALRNGVPVTSRASVNIVFRLT